jgi:hypothetical protein
MGKSTTFGNNILDHIFRNADITLIGDATGVRGSTTAGSLYISAHTADPGDAGTQSTSEAAYTGYARVAVPRNGTNWSVPASQAINNLLAITFGACTAGSSSITHLGVGTDPSGVGKLLYSSNLGNSVQGAFTGAVTDNITIPGHTLAVDDRVAFYAVFGSALPTGITEGTIYWVKTSATDVITISTTQGGTVLDITGVGDGVCLKAAVLAVSVGITPEVPIAGLVVKEE